LNICLEAAEIPSSVQLALFLFAFLCAIVSKTSFYGALSAMRDTAAKGATQIRPFGIGRLSEKEDAAMSTLLEVGTQASVGSKGGS